MSLRGDSGLCFFTIERGGAVVVVVAKCVWEGEVIGRSLECLAWEE